MSIRVQLHKRKAVVTSTITDDVCNRNMAWRHVNGHLPTRGKHCMQTLNDKTIMAFQQINAVVFASCKSNSKGDNVNKCWSIDLLRCR